MVHFLVATDSVHTTATACDYLDGRLADGDAVTVLSVVGGNVDVRDAADALNVASVRLPVEHESVQREGDPATTIRTVAGERSADELVIGARRGDPEAAGEGLGGTAGAVLADADRPVVVLP